MKKNFFFKLDKSKNSYNNFFSLKNEIEKIVNLAEFSELKNQLSILTEIPHRNLELKLKNIIFNKYNFFGKKAGIFDIKFNYLRSIISIVFILLIFVHDFIFRRKKSENFDLIIENIEKESALNPYKKLISKIDNCLIITRSNYFCKNKFINSKNSNVLNYSFDILKGKKVKLLITIFNLLKLSFKHDIDLIYFFTKVFWPYYKFSNIFSLYKSDFLLNDRLYHTCSIKNHLFKKYGGKKIFCFQVHIAESTLSAFSDQDVLLTFGDEIFTQKKIINLGGNINRSIGCGSPRMEYSLNNFDKIKEDFKKIDILIIGLNITNWMATSKEIEKIYYEQISWLTKLSNKFDNLKFVYKHHDYFRGDKKEEQMLKDSRIKLVIRDKNFNSYDYLMNSELVFSFGSSMILESLGLGKPSFFLDPDLQNTTFFENLDYLKNFRVKSYEEIENLINEKFIKKNQLHIKSKSNDFCLPSKNTSDRIIRILKQYKSS